mgnify:CR=1 FL=1
MHLHLAPRTFVTSKIGKTTLINGLVVLKERQRLKLHNITRIDDTPVHKAFREALVNCLVNTDYFLSCGVVIKKEDDKLVIENPGSIRTGKKQMLRGGISDPGNKTLMKMFNMIGIGERAGSGIPDIYQVWENEGWATSVVEESYNPDRTRLTLEFAKKQAYKINDKKQTTKTESHREKIRNFLTENELASVRDISMEIGLTAESPRVILAKMEDVEPVGGNRKRKYKLRTEK